MSPQILGYVVPVLFMLAPVVWLVLWIRKQRRRRRLHRARIETMQQDFRTILGKQK